MKNIQFNDYSSLERCKDEPIHLIGSIQGFGCILIFSAVDHRLTHLSENAIHLFDLGSEEFDVESYKTLDIKYFLDKMSLQKIHTLNLRDFDTKNPYKAKTDFPKSNSIVSICATNDTVILEIEWDGEEDKHSDYYTHNQVLLDLVNRTDDFVDFSQLMVENIKEITGYDRVMIYKFDSDFNGEVYAEALSGDLTPFLGLNYPHTDIPEQARKLYRKHKCRMICDINEKQIPIFALNDHHQTLDLSASILRSSSPIHLKYLENMGVRATLTLSIMIGDQLWGLIACHHQQPRHISQNKRRSALHQCDFYASQIKRWERSEEYALVQEKEHIYQAIIEDGIKHKNLFEAITNQTYLLGLTSSSGGAVIRNGEVFTFGASIAKQEVENIHAFMQERKEHVFLTNELSKYYKESEHFKQLVSGLLYYRLDIDGTSAIMWFRKQLAEGKKWGGDPAAKSSSLPLTPRNSFEAWEEEVDGKSPIWRSHEIQAGLRLCAFLEREININTLTEQKKKFEVLTGELKEANEELNQFNWISSHDMKEPLRKIRLFVDQIKSEENLLSKTHQMYFSRIDVAAEYMQNLINDLLNYSSLTKPEKQSFINMKELVNEAIKDSNEEDVDFQVRFDENFRFQGVKLHLKQVLMNLFSNSVKFKSNDRPLRILIELAVNVDVEENNRSKQYHQLSVMDNGIGFSSDYKDKIFKVFQRLHNQQDFKGTGIGLALCKKVMESHDGFITAEGKEGEGAQFHLYFPVEKSKF